MVRICPNFLYFVFTTYNINVVAPLRDTQPATTTNFVWILTKIERFIAWCLLSETSYQLDMKPKLICFCSSRRLTCHRKWRGSSTLFPRSRWKFPEMWEYRLDSLTCCYLFYGYFCMITENLKRLRRLPWIKPPIKSKRFGVIPTCGERYLIL